MLLFYAIALLIAFFADAPASDEAYAAAFASLIGAFCVVLGERHLFFEFGQLTKERPGANAFKIMGGIAQIAVISVTINLPLFAPIWVVAAGTLPFYIMVQQHIYAPARRKLEDFQGYASHRRAVTGAVLFLIGLPTLVYGNWAGYAL